MAEAVKTFCFNACRLEDPVESFAEVDGSGNFSVLVRDKRSVLAEVVLASQVFDHFDSGIVERDVALACCALEFADDHLSPALSGYTFAL